MLILGQLNFGLNFASLLGIIYFIFGICYLISMITFLTQRANSLRGTSLVLYILQALVIPIFISFCGFILIFQGWRLDPILQFQQLLLFIIITYLSMKDILINASRRNRE
jgi:hypothetical protein